MIAGGHGDMTGDVNARSARKQRVSHLPGALAPQSPQNAAERVNRSSDSRAARAPALGVVAK
jgi:hypothetical protein